MSALLTGFKNGLMIATSSFCKGSSLRRSHINNCLVNNRVNLIRWNHTNDAAVMGAAGFEESVQADLAEKNIVTLSCLFYQNFGIDTALPGAILSAMKSVHAGNDYEARGAMLHLAQSFPDDDKTFGAGRNWMEDYAAQQGKRWRLARNFVSCFDNDENHVSYIFHVEGDSSTYAGRYQIVNQGTANATRRAAYEAALGRPLPTDTEVLANTMRMRARCKAAYLNAGGAEYDDTPTYHCYRDQPNNPKLHFAGMGPVKRVTELGASVKLYPNPAQRAKVLDEDKRWLLLHGCEMIVGHSGISPRFADLPDDQKKILWTDQFPAWVITQAPQNRRMLEEFEGLLCWPDTRDSIKSWGRVLF